MPPRAKPACRSSSAASSGSRTACASSRSLKAAAVTARFRASSRRAGARPRKASTGSRGRTSTQRLPDCLALWLPGAEPARDEAAWLRERFEGRLWVAVELAASGADRERLERLTALAGELSLPAVAAGDVHMHQRRRRALQDLLTAVRLKTTVARAGRALHPNGERALRPLERIESLYPRPLVDATRDIAGRCRFSLDELRYEYPEEIVPAGTTPAAHLRRLVEAGAARRWPAGPPAAVRQLIERELALIARARLRALFPDRARPRRVRARARHPVPGTRLGGELRRLLRARHHRGGPGAHVDAVRALHLARAQRAPRHRRGLRARAARGGDPVSLREVRPRPRGAHGDGDLLPAEERRARRRQGPRPRSGPGRAAGARDAMVGRPRGRGLADPRRGLRHGEPRHRAGARAHARTDRLPAPPVAAHRRLRDLARAARGARAHRERGDAGAHGHPVGQGRPRRAPAAQGGRPRPRHADGDPPRARARLGAPGHGLRPAGHSRPRIRPSTR